MISVIDAFRPLRREGLAPPSKYRVERDGTAGSGVGGKPDKQETCNENLDDMRSGVRAAGGSKRRG
jgi:hypothetical protein